jgi:hypothetical protein
MRDIIKKRYEKSGRKDSVRSPKRGMKQCQVNMRNLSRRWSCTHGLAIPEDESRAFMKRGDSYERPRLQDKYFKKDSNREPY